MVVEEDPRYTRDYLDPSKRFIANAVRVVFADGSATDLVEVEVPLGHPRRRAEAVPLLREKLVANLAAAYGDARAGQLTTFLLDDGGLSELPADALLDRLTTL
jgi:2-methylcitrate dehydratase